MTNDELNQLLRGVQIPERENSFWDNFPGKVTRKLDRVSTQGTIDRSPKLTFALWGIGLAAACLVVVFWFGFRNGHSPGVEEQIAIARKYFQEVESLFTHQVRAIIFENGEARLMLSEHPDIPASSPLFLQICSGKNCRSLITFSGQQIQISGEPFEVLTDHKGQILLVGNHSVWSSAEPARMRNQSIQAQPLKM